MLYTNKEWKLVKPQKHHKYPLLQIILICQSISLSKLLPILHLHHLHHLRTTKGAMQLLKDRFVYTRVLCLHAQHKNLLFTIYYHCRLKQMLCSLQTLDFRTQLKVLEITINSNNTKIVAIISHMDITIISNNRLLHHPIQEALKMDINLL